MTCCETTVGPRGETTRNLGDRFYTKYTLYHCKINWIIDLHLPNQNVVYKPASGNVSKETMQVSCSEFQVNLLWLIYPVPENRYAS